MTCLATSLYNLKFALQQVIHGVSKETLGALKILLREAYKSKKEALRGAMKYLRDTSVVTAVKDVYKVVTDG